MIDDAQIEALIRKVAETMHGKKPSSDCELYIVRELEKFRKTFEPYIHVPEDIKDIKERLVRIEKLVEEHERERQNRKKGIALLIAGVGFVVARTMWDFWEWMLAALGVK